MSESREIYLETFLLRTSVATGSTWEGYQWTRHWAIRIDTRLYELVPGEKAFILPSFTFGLAAPDVGRQVISSTRIGWTHLNDERLRAIASQVENEQSTKWYIVKYIKGYLLPLNNCQTTAIKFWERIRCAVPEHGHQQDTMPIQGRSVFAGVLAVVDTGYIILEDWADKALEVWWPAFEHFGMDSMHSIADVAHHAVDWIHLGHISDMAMAIGPFALGGVFGAVRYGWSLYRGLRWAWRAGQLAVGLFIGGELLGWKWREMFRMLGLGGGQTGAIGDA